MVTAHVAEIGNDHVRKESSSGRAGYSTRQVLCDVERSTKVDGDLAYLRRRKGAAY